jgi:hypothetical protein
VPVRTDPTDTGGMFVGRRPGTAPVRYRALPQLGPRGRRRLDSAVANAIAATMVVLNLCFWGPIPAGGLWVAGQVQWRTSNVGLSLLVGFAIIMAGLMLGLAVLKRLDHFWVLARRASGREQRRGILTPVFATTAVVGGAAFAFWLIVIAGPGPMLAPTG